MPALQPVEYTRHSHTGAINVSVVLLAVSLGSLFLFKGWRAINRSSARSATQPVVAREVASPPAQKSTTTGEGTPSFETTLAESQTAPRNAFSRDFSVETTAPTVTAAISSHSQPTFRLQAIFYRTARPSAVINGRTLFVGDHLDDAKIVSIAREAVTLLAHGETKVLTLY
jgi:hypothetical protein